MRPPWSLLPALALVVATTTLLGPVGAAPVAASAAPARDDQPLQVTIDRLTPAEVPARGRIRMRGTVTNASDERWRAINVYAFMAATPITSGEELAEAVTIPFESEVGARIVDPGTFDSVGSLDPGESASFSVRLRRDQLPASSPGVYWFGAHALGNTDAARDGIADGRARTFLPLVPPSTRATVQTSIVLPVRRPVSHTVGGRIRAVGRWAEDLAPDGRLGAPLALATAEGAGPVTWLVDPAVPDAVARLVAGNPTRSLGATPDPEAPQDQAPEDPPDEDESEAADAADGGSAETSANPAVERGATWLDRMRSALTVDEVLALPYGDLDLAAVAAADPSLYRTAVRRTGTQLEQWSVDSDPAAASLSGLLPPEVIDLVEPRTTVLLSERGLRRPAPDTAVTIGGRRVVVTSSATGQGGPGPEDRLGAIAMRQRVLADAALRVLSDDRQPLVVVMPAAFRPENPATFWRGTDVKWLDLGDVADLDVGPELPPRVIDYPVDEQLTELDESALDAARALIAAGRTLQGILTDNDRLADQTLDEALSSIGYHDRSRALESRADTLGAIAWVTGRLQGVRIRAPKGVTLSSAAGRFAATLTNRLRHPVTVSVRPVSQGDVSIEQPEPVELPARGRQSVEFNATTSSPGVHYVRLVVTDAEGTPLGADQRIPIRSAQVSDVIWVIMGVGVGLLFVAIAVRVFRRVRSERA
ncbi:DUF6049 family protein [Nocardioides coralli]|uniref:DUF6049 family protein n=1 Tax=Nocardioides coralli TaxID=2872154 RepID=UPI001CA3CF4A|nr:DUF6049 family protein [Nocardioides coralli]QZY29144.1 DUF6049 family protein [Nocardioides coralli]